MVVAQSSNVWVASVVVSSGGLGVLLLLLAVVVVLALVVIRAFSPGFVHGGFAAGGTQVAAVGGGAWRCLAGASLKHDWLGRKR